MHSLFAFLSLSITIIDDALHLVIFGFAIKRKLYRQLVFFFAYIMLLAPRDLAWSWISQTPMFHSLSGFYFYWISDFILASLRLATIIEICWRTLRNYPAVWTFAWRILVSIGSVLLLWAIFSAVHNNTRARHFITAGMQRFEFMQAILLLIVLAIGVYYRIHIPHLYRWVLIGICFYSAMQVANYELGSITIHPTNTVFDFVRRYSATFSEGIWTWAVWRWAATPVTPTEQIPQAVYDEHSAEVHDRLRDLNDRLSKLLRHTS